MGKAILSYKSNSFQPGQKPFQGNTPYLGKPSKPGDEPDNATGLLAAIQQTAQRQIAMMTGTPLPPVAGNTSTTPTAQDKQTTVIIIIVVIAIIILGYLIYKKKIKF